MTFKYQLPQEWVEKVLRMEEFANGATQVTIRLKDGRQFGQILVSTSKYLVAARGYTDLPFRVSEIEEVFQTSEDKSPVERAGWQYWDNWKGNE